MTLGCFFFILKLELSFLQQPIDTWKKNPAIVNAKLVIDHIKVVNDAAERGVKLAQDFQGAARKEKRYQNVLQVVENPRKLIPDQGFSKTGQLWYLINKKNWLGFQF